jgi:hypothetical protein
MQTVNWERIRTNEINVSLQWIDNIDKINEIATDKDIHEMIKAGISEKSAKKIARETEHALITLYVEDQKLKRIAELIFYCCSEQ